MVFNELILVSIPGAIAAWAFFYFECPKKFSNDYNKKIETILSGMREELLAKILELKTELNQKAKEEQVELFNKNLISKIDQISKAASKYAKIGDLLYEYPKKQRSASFVFFILAALLLATYVLNSFGLVDFSFSKPTSILTFIGLLESFLFVGMSIIFGVILKDKNIKDALDGDYKKYKQEWENNDKRY